MREIKFRAFDKEIEGGHMVYSDGRDKADRQVEYDFLIDEKGNLVCVWFEDYDDSCGFSQINSGTLDNLMQFTGVYDKNGKEIYEGDIVKAWDRGVYGVKEVKWRQEASPCYILYPAENIGQWYLSAINIDGAFVDKGVEVIGNIHENPELLEQRPC